MDWLLDSDPALRWQVERDLAGAPEETWTATRARVATEGLGARLLALQDPDGQWAGGAFFPHDASSGEDGQPWTATTWSLNALREWGLDATALGAFAGRMPEDVAAAQLRKIEQVGLQNLTFGWAGGTEPGERHYFRIQGPVLLIEHDNTEDNGAHIHSVWRNPVDDFGDDILGEHYRQHHGG
jgi:hypothetical protein